MDINASADQSRESLSDAVARVEEAIAKLEAAWQDAEEPELAPLLPPPSDSWFRGMLLELIKVDLEMRWQAKRKKPLEDYLEEWPILASDSEAVADLLESECVTRAVWDTLPDADEVQRRFPETDVDWVAVQEASNKERIAKSLLKPGQSFGKHEIRELIGMGGMGVVYRAYHPGLECEVALKLPLNRASNPDRLLKRFQREAPAAAQVRHPHICPVLDAGQEDGQPYLTMALVDGPSLATRLELGPIDQTVAAEVVWKLSGALSAIHAAELIHRDIKPSNVLLDQAGEPLLTDFGLAPVATPSPVRASQARSWLRTTGYHKAWPVQSPVCERAI